MWERLGSKLAVDAPVIVTGSLSIREEEAPRLRVDNVVPLPKDGEAMPDDSFSGAYAPKKAGPPPASQPEKLWLRVQDTAQMQQADVAYVMPSHQFPMGTVMPLARRQELLDWAAARPGRYILEDDHDSEFRYVGKPIPSLQSRDRNDCVIYIGTFSKSISPALRMSYMVLPRHLGELFRSQYGFYSSTVSTQQQLTVSRFMQNGDFERHLNRMRRIYKAKHDFLLRELKRRAWVARIQGENAGLHLVVTVKTDQSEQMLLEAAGKRGVQLYGMSSYQIDKEQHVAESGVTLLFGFGGLSEEEITEGLEILDELL